MRHFALLIAILAAVAVIAGCGGSSDSSGSASGSPSSTSDSSETTTSSSGEEPTDEGGEGEEVLAKLEFISEADAICKRIQKKGAPLESQYSQLGESANTPPELKKLAGVVRKLLGYASEGIGEVQALDEPPADTKAVEDYAAVIDERISTGEEFADALEKGERSQANGLLEEAGEIATQAEKMASDYGFEVCGSSK